MPPLTSNKRLSGLDHLRSLAIILVFLYHYRLFGNPPIVDSLGKFGWTGVDLFFVLSGYLIGGQLLGALAKGRPLSYSEFYFKRSFRILPAYILVLVLYYTIPAFTERSHLPPLWKFITFTQNFGLDLGTQAAFSHAWSLCIEEQFYLLLPLFIAALAAGINLSSFPKRLGAVLAFLVLAGLLTRWTCWRFFVAPVPEEQQWRLFYKWIYYPTYSRLDGLLAGLGLAALFHFRPLLWQKITRHGNAILILSLVLITGAAYCCNASLFGNAVPGFLLVALAYGALVLSALCPGSILYRFKSRVTAFIAAISYSFYLVHKQMIHLTHLVLDPDGSARDSYRLFWASTALALAAAISLHFLVERPFLRLRDRMLARHTGG